MILIALFERCIVVLVVSAIQNDSVWFLFI